MSTKTKKKCPTCGFEGDLARFVPARAQNNLRKTAKETDEKKFFVCPNCGAYVGMIPKEENKR